MSGITDLIGNQVQNGQGQQVNVSDFCGTDRYVGLYFSAHWCPPCRGFTPVLAEFYKSVKAGPNGDKLEIVFVSSDRDVASFKDYFGEMPWLALDYTDRDLKEKLCNHFGVRGIPTFVILNATTGAVVHADGRGKVMADQKGESFPWPV